MRSMFAMDHRLALVVLSALILAAAASLAAAWARLLPVEREPFARSPESQARPERNTFAVVLLCLVTLSFLLRLPGVSLNDLRPWLAAHLLAPWPERLLASASFLLVFLPGFASCYAVSRPNSLRLPLILAGALVLLLWLSAPFLSAAWLATN